MRSSLRFLFLLLSANTLLSTPLLAQQATSDAWLSAEPAADLPAPFAILSGSVVEYAYDDGTANVNIGPPSSFDPDMLWGNYFVTEPGGEVITELSVAFGSTFPSLENEKVSLWLLDDPDMDFDPRDATVLAEVTIWPEVFGNTFVSAEIPPTEVSGAFFVAANAFLQGGEDRPARVDTDARADRSWFFYAPDMTPVLFGLAAAPFSTRMDDTEVVPFPGAFMIRAVGVPSTGVANTTDDEPAAASGTFVLDAAYPNPFAQSTTIPYELPAAAHVKVEVFDVTGRRVASLVNEVQPAGPHEAQWDATGLAPGLYLGRLQVGDRVRTQRLLVLP